MTKKVIIIGGGPAGLMAAQVLAGHGIEVNIFDAKPSPGHKFLLAGRSGLNLTHTEGRELFVKKYGENQDFFSRCLERFGPDEVRKWAYDLRVATFVGTSGRVFPKDMNAKRLLRAWLVRLGELGVTFHGRKRWIGFSEEGGAQFEDGDTQTADAYILALGGASWPRTGSDGKWVPVLKALGISSAPLRPANCGLLVDWSDIFVEKFEGHPLKAIRLEYGDQRPRGDVLITKNGLEGGIAYQLSAAVRDALEAGDGVTIFADLKPDLTLGQIEARLNKPRGKQSLSNFLRKGLRLGGPNYSLLREGRPEPLPEPANELAALIKHAPIRITGTMPIDKAISTAGGVLFSELDERLMLKKQPGIFLAGEMLDWEAPTGGYLLQGCFSTGHMAAAGVLSWLD